MRGRHSISRVEVRRLPGGGGVLRLQQVSKPCQYPPSPPGSRNRERTGHGLKMALPGMSHGEREKETASLSLRSVFYERW